MKINLVYTSAGTFIPETDFDREAKKHLHVGDTYAADIRMTNNAEFHRKYMKMLRTAWEFLPEAMQKFFRNWDAFRKYVEMTAGYYEVFFSPTLKEFVQGPKSIAFDRMDQAEREDLYEAVRNVLDGILLGNGYISQEQFESVFMQF